MARDQSLDAGDVWRRIAQQLAGEPATADLARVLFQDADPDAFADLGDAELVAIAREGAAFCNERPQPGPKIAVARSGSASFVRILNDDMPFLVDSVMAEIQARGHAVRFLLHPILKVMRRPDGRLDRLVGPGDRNWSDGSQESFIMVALEPLGEASGAGLAAALEDTLLDVRRAVTDWPTMIARIDRAVAELESSPPPVPPGLLAETLAFCRWLREGHLVFLGMREFKLAGEPSVADLVPVEGSGLGVLRDPTRHVLTSGGEVVPMTDESRQAFMTPNPLIIAKSSILSRVHRRAYMDYFGLKTYRADGRLSGELRVVGLLTSQAYTRPPQSIPVLRHKVDSVVSRLGFAPASHDQKALINILDTLPRDELLQLSDQELAAWSRRILDLELRPRVLVLARLDRFDRFASVLVYVPRDRFSTLTRERIGRVLAEAFDGKVSAFTPYFPEGPLVRVHFIIGRNEGPPPAVDAADLHKRVMGAVRTWGDRLELELAGGGPELAPLVRKYRRAFSAGYAELFSPARALEDVRRIERLGPERPIAIDFYRDADMPPTQVRVAIYAFDRPIPLAARVPRLENMGLRAIDERSYRLKPRFPSGKRVVALHDMMLESARGEPIDIARHEHRLEACYLAVHAGDADDDTFNRLIVAAGADWRETAMLRAYAAYLRQLGAPFGPRYIADTLERHAGLTRDLIELFRVRFDPARFKDAEARATAEADVRKRFEGALGGVESLDEDRILRRCLNLIESTVRTSFFRPQTGEGPPTIAFKLVPADVDDMPEPRPFREIWMFSPRVEGVHLRFAPIARGGLRWSDRAQDFRTEVLGLCKAQQVKNTVIVPSGAKGGFLPKRLPRGGSRDEIMAEGVAAYRTFVSALLDVTDNVVSGKIAPPADVVRHDEDDPYLVVAADKGTATFSDFANEISLTRGHWLGDAFASGGSAGYDHKKMAITARGAWECVKRHFREMNVDIQSEPFTVAGVGDMSGDVFGNGMLLSPAIRLVAAFDHRDIFIDPEPDPAVGLAERRRLFELPRSSWQDYDRSRISNGGGVFSRSAKSIPLSPEIRRLLGVAGETATPAELLRHILKADVDLMWFGGIGTYIKAPGETDEQVGDRANDGIRILAGEARCKVIGEGANLGVSQRGRIELARRGVRLNTDFIDNSAGVNSSDQEVNIKIAIGPAVADGRLDADARGRLLASMTEDVAGACLMNNYQQSLAISLAEWRSGQEIGYLARLVRRLEEQGLINRRLEALPDDAELSGREAAGMGLTRPEIAVLLSWSKIALSNALRSSALPDDPAFAPLLFEYFPPALREAHRVDIAGHRLRREIIATRITNSVVNRGGPAFVVRLEDETGRSAADIAYACMASRVIYDLPRLWQEIDQLDTRIDGALQLELYQITQDHLLRQTATLLRARQASDLQGLIDAYRPGAADLSAMLADCATRPQLERLDAERSRLEGGGVPAATAEALARLSLLRYVPAIAEAATATGQGLALCAAAQFKSLDYLHVAAIEQRGHALPGSDYYSRLAISGAITTLERASDQLARELVRAAENGRVPDPADWARAGGAQGLANAKAVLQALVQTGDFSLPRLAVVAGQVRDLLSG